MVSENDSTSFFSSGIGNSLRMPWTCRDSGRRNDSVYHSSNLMSLLLSCVYIVTSKVSFSVIYNRYVPLQCSMKTKY